MNSKHMTVLSAGAGSTAFFFMPIILSIRLSHGNKEELSALAATYYITLVC